MAYILGFFAADGYMTINKRGARFWSIQITDKELLEDIKRTVGSEHRISRRIGSKNEKSLYRLQIGSKEMYADLSSLGFTQGKTKSLAVPQIPARYFRHFVRGYFDGDGNVWSGYVHKERARATLSLMTIFTSCSLRFLVELRRRLRLHFILKGVLTKKKGNCYRLAYSISDSLKLYDFMYNHPVPEKDSLFLVRKRVVFERFMKMRS